MYTPALFAGRDSVKREIAKRSVVSPHPPSGFLPVKDNMLALRNVGALKLSNILQLDRFEEDLNISKVRLPQHAWNG